MKRGGRLRGERWVAEEESAIVFSNLADKGKVARRTVLMQGAHVSTATGEEEHSAFSPLQKWHCMDRTLFDYRAGARVP